MLMGSLEREEFCGREEWFLAGEKNVGPFLT